MDSSYDIVPYGEDLLEGCVAVLRPLWGWNDSENRAYFKWKYEENPYRSAPQGVVALQGDKVVGFRGYFATRWRIPDRQAPFTVLCPGDTCVDPEHQRRGLSVAMGTSAIDHCMNEARLLLSMSATSNSVPGYLKLGFLPLVTKTYLSRCSLLGLVRVLAGARLKWSPPNKQIRFGRFGDITVSDHPDPEAMARIAAAATSAKGTLSLIQDKEFFAWRFLNPRNKYIFYFHHGPDDLAGYAILRFSPAGRRGYLIDYAERVPGSMRQLIHFIAQADHADVLSVSGAGMDPENRTVFTGLGFKATGLLSAIERRTRGEWPIAVRPVPRRPEEEDWWIGGLDVRSAASWRLREIGSDGV